jgi:hypothetical protein
LVLVRRRVERLVAGPHAPETLVVNAGGVGVATRGPSSLVSPLNGLGVRDVK